MKRFLVLVLTFLTAFCAFGLANSEEANAQVSLELVGKLGGASNYFDDDWLGDPRFSVSGGLKLAALVRFDVGFGVGLNFNWQMADQKLRYGGLQKELLDKHNRNVVVQHPSFGVTFRYLFIDMLGAGIWFNYGFGNVKFDSINFDEKNTDITVPPGYLNRPELKYQLQTFEIAVNHNVPP